ncbi:MAG: PqqD family protein [Clostridia bacterium]|nr:PqqD family protein [Clostridia bacterium]
MKIKEGYLLRDVAGSHVVVSVGSVDFDGMIRLNDTGVFLWKKLSDGIEEKALTEALLAEYDVAPEVAEQDVSEFVAGLRKAGLLDE